MSKIWFAISLIVPAVSKRMKVTRRSISALGYASASPFLTSCQTRQELHAAAFTPAATIGADRVLQTRRFDTRDEALLLQSAVGVLQDLGFTIEETRPQSGLVMGSKDRNAVEAGQVAVQLVLVLLAAAAKSQHRVVMDQYQKIRVLVVLRPTQDRQSSAARVTFQRVVFNSDNQVSQLETLSDVALYRAFFDQLSQSAFLTAHEI